MTLKIQILKLIVTALLLGPLFLHPVYAQSSETELLEQLRGAPESDVTRLERELGLIWDRSGSASMDLLLKRGREAMEDEDNDRAIEHFSALTDHAPQFAEGWHARATAFYRKGLYGPALDDLERALALNPNNYNAIFGLGVMLQDFGDLQRASDAFDRVLALNPHHEQAKAAKEQLEKRGIGRTL
ncbi:MAG: tetratricopeptide repeat protein [Roseobacter sp.]